VGKVRRRNKVPNYLLAYLQRRRYYVVVAAGLLVVIAVLLFLSRTLEHYGMNLSLNLGADLIGTIVVLFLIAPFMGRAEKSQEAVLERFDHRAFIRQAGDARHRILILELWTDLLQGGFKSSFLASLRNAVERGVDVRMLVLDPDARAAEQRADDLLRQTDVVDNILDNLQILHEFRESLPDRVKENLDIRVYSALPPVQMYRVDDHVIVSFYPVNVTSWNAAQYQTSPHAQLGTFVGTKFDELWEARSTRTLEQFREINVEVDGGGRYPARFVSAGDHIYVIGHEIIRNNLRSGIDGLPARVLNGNAKGEKHSSRLYSLTPLDSAGDELATARDLFRRKYGESRYDVILKLSAAVHTE
jgi:hypothetical protein